MPGRKRDAVRKAAVAAGFLGQAAVARRGAAIDRMIVISRDLTLPPVDTLFLQRKGVLCTRLEAKAGLRAMIETHR